MAHMACMSCACCARCACLVDIQIEDQHPLHPPLPQQQLRGDGQVVQDAETCRRAGGAGQGTVGSSS